MFSYFSFLSDFLYLILGINSSNKFPPPLDKEEEQKYFERAKQGDRDARRLLIEHNLRLVAHIVRKYYSNYPSQDDLISIGSIGLIKSIDSFKCGKGTRFATYAAKCIQNEILMYFRSQKKLACEVSINETIDTDRDGNPLTYTDIISCSDTIAEDIDRKIHQTNALKYIKQLGERERQIIVMRYGLDGQKPRTQKQVAELLGISRSYVSRIEKSTLEELAQKLGGRPEP
jgi:RNA polymerase sporulation-specific sigma factor